MLLYGEWCAWIVFVFYWAKDGSVEQYIHMLWYNASTNIAPSKKTCNYAFRIVYFEYFFLLPVLWHVLPSPNSPWC